MPPLRLYVRCYKAWMIRMFGWGSFEGTGSKSRWADVSAGVHGVRSDARAPQNASRCVLLVVLGPVCYFSCHFASDHRFLRTGINAMKPTIVSPLPHRPTFQYTSPLYILECNWGCYYLCLLSRSIEEQGEGSDLWDHFSCAVSGSFKCHILWGTWQALHAPEGKECTNAFAVL